MAYRIDFDKSLADEVRHIAARQLSDAATLLESQPDGPHEAIHDARKHIKRTRALYRLIASDAGEFTAAENDRLREIATELSHLRDAAALVESASYLAGEIEDDSLRVVVTSVAASLEKRREKIAGDESEIGDKLKIAAAGLRDAMAALDELKLPGSTSRAGDCIAAGWRKISTKAMKALKECATTHESVPYHDLRKRAQDRWMHAALLRSVWPAALIAIQNQAKALVDMLGHEHDLVVLSAHIAASDDHVAGDDKNDLLLAIFEQRLKLQQSCRKAGKDVFDHESGRDAAIVRLLIDKKT